MRNGASLPTTQRNPAKIGTFSLTDRSGCGQPLAAASSEREKPMGKMSPEIMVVGASIGLILAAALVWFVIVNREMVGVLLLVVGIPVAFAAHKMEMGKLEAGSAAAAFTGAMLLLGPVLVEYVRETTV